MIAAVIHLTARAYYLLYRVNPANWLIDAARNQPRWWHPPLAAITGIVCWLAAAVLLPMWHDGQIPGWTAWALIILIWDAIKLLLAVPFSLWWLARHHWAAWPAGRDWRRAGGR